MSRNQETDSSSAIVEAIFGDSINSGAKAHYEKRLRENYVHKKNESKHPRYFVRRSHDGGQYGRNHLSEEVTNYFENLLLLDSLFGRPKKVFEVLGEEPEDDLRKRSKDPNEREKAAERFNKSKEFRIRNAKQQIQQRRAELQPILEQTQAVLDRSEPWERIPEDFDLWRDRLGGLLVPPDKSTPKRSPADSWKFPMAEKIRRIEESPEWQDGDPEKAAERAMCYHEMGNTELAHLQIDEELAQHPEEPVLYYVKAVLLMEGASHHWKQSFLHRELGAQGAALTAEERWHEERAFDESCDAADKETEALKQLMACYGHWDVDKLPGWARYNSRHDAELLLIQKIIGKACLHLRLHVNFDFSLERPVPKQIKVFIEKVHLAERFELYFYKPEYFGSLLGYWNLCRVLKPDLHQASVKKWLDLVIEGLEHPKDGIWRTWDWFKCPLEGPMKFQHPFRNQWPEMIVAACGKKELKFAFDSIDIFDGFLPLMDAKYSSQIADKHLWNRMQLEWAQLVSDECDTPWKRIQVCRKALDRLPWAESSFSVRWKMYWLYAEARCHFDAAVLLADEDKRLASGHLSYVETQLAQHPDLGKKEVTHFTLDESCEEYDSERESDIIGNETNVFSWEVREATKGENGWPGCSASDSMFLVSFRLSEVYFGPRPTILDRFDAVCQKLYDLEGSPFERLLAYLKNGMG